MNATEAEEIGRAWAAAAAWRCPWAPKQPKGRSRAGRDARGVLWRLTTGEGWPDPRDPATVGCMLATVREAWGDPTIYIEVGFVGPDAPPSAWLRSGQGRDAPYAKEASEPAALVAALVALRGAK